MEEQVPEIPVTRRDDTVVEALESALHAAYERTEGAQSRARVALDRKTGEVTVWAQEVDDAGEVVREYEDTPSDFGRIALAVD